MLESGHVSHFNFAFPEDIGSGDTASEQDKAFKEEMDSLLGTPKAQALPPSGEFGSGNSITYSLEASLIEENYHHEIKASTTLEFSKTREFEAPDPQIITIVQEKLLASQDSTLAPLRFNLTLDSPQVIIQEQPFPLMLQLSHGNSRTTSSPPTTVLFRSYLVQLLENTAIQSTNNTQDYWTNKHPIASWDLSSLESNARAPSITTQGLDTEVLIHNLSIPLRYAPTFDCENIELTYGLEVSLTVEYAGETFDLGFDVGAMTVMAAEWVGEERANEEGMVYMNLAGKDPRFRGLFKLV